MATFGLAYVDPGSGSFFVQALVGVVAGAAFAFRARLRRAAEALRRMLGRA